MAKSLADTVHPAGQGEKRINVFHQLWTNDASALIGTVRPYLSKLIRPVVKAVKY